MLKLFLGIVRRLLTLLQIDRRKTIYGREIYLIYLVSTYHRLSSCRLVQNFPSSIEPFVVAMKYLFSVEAISACLNQFNKLMFSPILEHSYCLIEKLSEDTLFVAIYTTHTPLQTNQDTCWQQSK